MKNRRNADLEGAITASLDDPSAYKVYADWLEENGEDGRATLIREQLKKKPKPEHDLLDEKTLGPLWKFWAAFSWKWGFISSANLSERTNLKAGPALAATLAHPLGAFVRNIELYVIDRPQPAVDALTEAPTTLRGLRFFSPLKLARIEGLERVFTQLEQLVLDGKFELATPLKLPRAWEIAIEIDALSDANVKQVNALEAPLLQGLTLGLAQTTDAAKKLAPLFARKFEKLDYLVISDAADLDALCELIAVAPFAPQLKGIELDGRLSERGVEALRSSTRLAKLKDITLGGSVDKRFVASLRKKGRSVERYDSSAE
ncbi:MAG: TIGR02996 domain-containing protein [Archangium sp.]|nr:TIGR02996 domain-containing protein [Archangium sp.]